MNKEKNQGQMIIFAIVFLALFLVASASLLGYTTLNLKGTRQSYHQNQALFLAEAGVEKAIYELNKNSGYTGETNTLLGQGEFSVTVSSIDYNTKSITATGYVPSSANPLSVRIVRARANIDTTNISFNFGVQVGIGGLEMDNNSRINGNVFSNGNITGGNASTTGDVIVAAGTNTTADQEWTVQNQDFSFGNISAKRDVAQSFKPSLSDRLNKIQIFIKKVGTPSDLTVRLMTDNNGAPSKTSLAVTNISASKITNLYNWIEATFISPANLIAGTSYWLMISAQNYNAGNYYIWGSDSNNGYGNGVGKYSENWQAGNPVWVNVGGDLNYRTFMGGVVTYFDGDIEVGGNLTATEIRNCGKVIGTAYYETIFTLCPAGFSVSSSTIPGPETFPISQANINSWKKVAEDNGVIEGDYTISGFETMGPKKINGNLILNLGAILNLTGPVWVKGNITISNNAIIRVDLSLGNTGTVLLADNPDNPSESGIINISNNAFIEGNGSPNSYPVVLTNSTNSTGAMIIANNAMAAIYYAPNGTIRVSQNAGGNQITGKKIHLDENAVIIYQSGLQNAGFSNGPGGSWVFLPGSYVIEK